jgi:adenylosuccinate synthase
MPAYIAETMRHVAMRFTIVTPAYLKRLAEETDLIFEGAQGVLLDEWRGFHPHTTWSTTTFANALEILREIGYGDPVRKLGLLRGYFTRHGAGPFPTEDFELTNRIPDVHNGDSGWQKQFRVGWFDAVLARYALAVSGGADSLVLTCLDRLESVGRNIRIALSYRHTEGRAIQELPINPNLTDLAWQEKVTDFLKTVRPVYEEIRLLQLPEKIEEHLRIPVSIVSRGPSAVHKHERALAAAN